MFPLIFQIPQLPDLKSQKYLALYGQNTRNKAISSQKDFLLLLGELGRIYHLTCSIRYLYLPSQPFDRQLGIYLVVGNGAQTQANPEKLSEISAIITQGFLKQFYQIVPVQDTPEPMKNLAWATYIGESLKYEEIIASRPKDALNPYKKLLPSYYVPLPWETNEGNDMLVLAEAMSSFNSALMLDITLQPDTTSLQAKSAWINALDQMLSQLREASRGSGFKSRNEDRNAQLVSRIYDQYQSSYLTESLYRYSVRVFGENELSVRSILGTLILSGTQKSRSRTVILTPEHPKFAPTCTATQQGKLSTEIHWEAWDQGLGDAEFGGDSLSGTVSVRVADLKPLHRLATLDEVSGLFRILVPGDGPVKGIRQENDIPSLSKDKQWIDFGGYETSRPEHYIQIGLEQLNKHAFICGVPGSGKTTTAFNLLTELYDRNIPFLVFEPAKTEYRSLLGIKLPPGLKGSKKSRLAQLPEELRVYTLGNDRISPFRFNPFEVSEAVPFYEHIANLEACFRGAVPLFGPLPALLSEALEEIYYDQGWTGNEEGTPPEYRDQGKIPTMRDLYEKITALFESKDYAGEVKSNLKAALEVRVATLLRRGVGAMLNTQQSSPTIAQLLAHPTILELDYLNQDQANLMTFFLLTKIREYVKRQRNEGPGLPEHLILLEEAHNIVGSNVGMASAEEANTQQEAANYITRMLAEMRALREAIAIADQLPTAVAPEVVKNTNIKIAHRLVSADDRQDIGQAMLLDESQMEEIARFNVGESFLYMEGWYRPRPVKVDRENSAKERLGLESSLDSHQLTTLISARPWYRQGQEAVLNTALAEASRLDREYQQSFKDIREHFDRVEKECSNLENLLNRLTTELFHRLVAKFNISPKPLPKDELEILLAAIDLSKPTQNNLKNLQAANLTLEDLLELKSLIAAKFAIFDQRYEEVSQINGRIPRSQYLQKCQQRDRQWQTILQQVTRLAELLEKPEAASRLEENREELDLEKCNIQEIEDPNLNKTIKRLKKQRDDWHHQLMWVVNRAIAQAKENKFKQNLQTGGE